MDGVEVPDATIDITGYDCATDELQIEICNICDISLPVGTPYMLYGSDPQIGTPLYSVGPFLTNQIVPGNGCITEIVNVGLPPHYFLSLVCCCQ